MAYMSQEKKAELAPAIKAIFKKYGIKGSIGVSNHSGLVVNIKSSKIDFIKNYNETIDASSQGSYWPRDHNITHIDVNPYHYHTHFSGKAVKCIEELLTAMLVGNHDNSDIQSDYFDIGWYVYINIGSWNKPYVVAK